MSPQGVRAIVNTVRANPTRLGSITCFAVDCLNRKYATPAAPQDPLSLLLSDADTLFSQLSRESDAFTVVAPDLISKFESNFWYHGISGDPPKLLWRSDLETNPFTHPTAGARFFKPPTKTAHGVFNTRLNEVWDDVAPKIIASMKDHSIKYSALKTARFSTLEDDDEDEMVGPIVVWIAVWPQTTKAGAVRDATPDIIRILADAEVHGVVVEWYEGVEDNTSPSFGLNHPFNTGLGIPIARLSDDAQGTLTLLFREVEDNNGQPSNRILVLTNKHFTEADPQHIVMCGKRRLARAITEIEDALNNELANLGDEVTMAVERRTAALKEKNENIMILQTLFDEVQADWKEVEGRKLSLVNWAPAIDVRVDDRHYTRDIATISVDKEKLGNFVSNIVDLGSDFDSSQLEDRFWTIASVRNNRTIPANLQLPIRSALPCRLIINLDTEDRNGDPLYIVGKYGNTTKLTLGHYSGMEAYTCTDLGLESREVVVYNYSKKSGDFSDHGDSGSLIFTGDGEGLAILHSGMPRGMHNHVTYGTPLWWVIKQILVKYPSAEALLAEEALGLTQPRQAVLGENVEFVTRGTH
ncbi:hypothetical protein CPB84DRAFT_1838678 [Gymnopilus junonius]|uniref:Uncharacterized protein n=1 Tax=Gymnopilus junonius TaxID=109634 RepID=A0A9P5NA30_GYMJU|nr:hypothetical protein CPB84DRAFT_1838678 [Gymnopilus junonius]